MIVRSHTELIQLESFESRFEYLKLGGGIGQPTFGYARQINQDFYASREWEDVRLYVIIRDDGCDLGVPGYDIPEGPVIHHMNVMTVDDIIHGEGWILDPEYLITTTHQTHNAIHYGSDILQPPVVAQRSPNDTTLWQRR